MNTKIVKIVMSTATIVLLSACGGDSGGDSSGGGSSGSSLSGSVIDPEVKGAKVSLVCGTQTYNANSVTNDDGEFTITNIPSGSDLSSCILEAEGGIDGGDDLTGLTMKAPYKMFSNGGIYITPFTTAVAEHDSSDLNTSLHAVATFFGVTPEDLAKNPTSDINLAKITKKITKLAISKKSSGELVGYVDIDGNGNGFTNLSDYTNNNTDTNATTKVDLQAELDLIEEANSIADIIKSGIIIDGVNQLELAYKQDKYSENEKVNFKAISTVISNQLTTTTEGETAYGVINRYHIRKALSDLEITPSFEDNNTLTTSISDKIDQADLNTSAIDVSDISGLVLFDSSSYETIVGDDNAKRIGYYTFSDKSNIANLLEISENSYTDSVLDSINANIGLGLAKLGFIDEAFENIEDNVYTPDAKEDAYKGLGDLFLELENNEKAIEAYSLRFDTIKAQIEAVGKSNVSSGQTSDLQTIATKLVKAQDTTKVDEVVTYLESLAPELGTTSGYGRIVQAFEDMSENIYLESGNLAKAKEYIGNGVTATQNIPTDNPKTAVYYTYRTAITASIFGNNTAALAAEAKATKIDPTQGYVSYGDSYEYFPIALEALVTEDINSTITKFGAMSSTTDQRNASNYGYAAGLLLNNQADELFTNVYNDTIFTETNKERIFYETRLGSSTTFYTSLILRIKGENVILEDYLDRLYDMSKDYDLSTAGDMQKIFAQWDDEGRNQYGYLAMAKMYLDLGETAKAENLIAKSIEKMDTLSDLRYKIDGYINILNARKELGLDSDATQTATIITNLKAAALNENFTDSEAILIAANVFSSNGAQDEAIPMIEKAYTSLPTQVDGSYNDIKDRIEFFIAENQDDVNVVNSYMQAGDLVKANEMVDEAYANIMTLADTVDRYALLVNVARAKASLNSLDGLDEILAQIKTPTENNLAKIEIATALANYDAFPLTNSASIDSDNDGKPDFWNKNATPQEIIDSGLTLDDDIDGDGISDDSDALPYDNID